MSDTDISTVTLLLIISIGLVVIPILWVFNKTVKRKTPATLGDQLLAKNIADNSKKKNFSNGR